MATQKKFHREEAYRIFAHELRDTNVVLEREEGQYAAQYVLTPTGAKVNKVFVVGTLTDIEDIGQDTPYWRVRINDPTGVFAGYAGEYQPEASWALSQASIPEMLAIVGKVSVYTPEDGGVIISIQPKTVATVDVDAMNRWNFQTAQQTLTRIQHLEASSPESIDDMKQYREMVRGVLTGMLE
jgi:RPA family protein